MKFTRLELINAGLIKQKKRKITKKPSEGTVAWDMWKAFSQYSKDKDRPITRVEAICLAEAKGWNKSNTQLRYYDWRNFNDIRGYLKGLNYVLNDRQRPHARTPYP